MMLVFFSKLFNCLSPSVLFRSKVIIRWPRVRTLYHAADADFNGSPVGDSILMTEAPS